MTQKRGFTILEIIIVAVFASLLFIVIFIQKADLDALGRDNTRKIAINAIYYALEEDFYKTHQYYPESISAENLPTVSPELWTDPSGFSFSDPQSSYSYQPANCHQGECQEYKLQTKLEKEDTYIKYNKTYDQE